MRRMKPSNVWVSSLEKSAVRASVRSHFATPSANPKTSARHQAIYPANLLNHPCDIVSLTRLVSRPNTKGIRRSTACRVSPSNRISCSSHTFRIIMPRMFGLSDLRSCHTRIKSMSLSLRNPSSIWCLRTNACCDTAERRTGSPISSMHSEK